MGQNSVKSKDANELAELRKQAGLWLREKRETAGLSQRDLAGLLGFDYYTFISQIEAGRGKVPAERYENYAKAVNVAPRDFALTMLRFNDPHTYGLIFGGETPSPANTDIANLESRLRRIEARLSE